MWHNALSEFPPYAPQLLLADTMRRNIKKSLILQYKDGVGIGRPYRLGFWDPIPNPKNFIADVAERLILKELCCFQVLPVVDLAGRSEKKGHYLLQVMTLLWLSPADLCVCTWGVGYRFGLHLKSASRPVHVEQHRKLHIVMSLVWLPSPKASSLW